MVERIKVTTPPFRVSFPSVFEASAYQGGEPKYSLVGLWYPQGCEGRPAWGKAEKEAWARMEHIADQAAMDRFKKKIKDLPDNFKKPFRKGEEKGHLGGYNVPGMVFATMSSKQRPGLIDRNKAIITSAEDFYPGCWARATVTAYAYDNKGKGVAFGLHNIQKLGDDTNFTGRVAADEDFGDDGAEWDDWDDGAAAPSMREDDPLG